MVSGPIDRFIQRVPGSVNTKAFVAAVGITCFASFAFASGSTRQGHSYFSHDKPEAVVAHEERMREEKRIKREQSEAK